MTLPELPIDPENPLGYVQVAPLFDHASRPCLDFHHSLAWVFWQSAIAKDYNGTFEHVRKLRRVILEGLQNRGCQVQKVRTPEFDYDVEVGVTTGAIGILINRVHAERSDMDQAFCHVVSKYVVNDRAIADAIGLNTELYEVIEASGNRMSPFGPGDIVMPGNFNYATMKGMFGGGIVQPMPTPPKQAYRTVRLLPEHSQGYEDAVSALADTTQIMEIQIMLGRLELIDMSSTEFNRFIHLTSARTHKFMQESSH